jgi:hypothetical protein
VSDYLEQIEELNEPYYTNAQSKVVPIVQALGPDRAANLLHAHCEASGFCAVHSCINHSCDPNVESFKSVDDVDGDVNLYAARRIEAGEELFLNYIDVESKTVQQRRAQLDAYGFSCQCRRCQEEELAAENGGTTEKEAAHGRGNKRKAGHESETANATRKQKAAAQ